MFYRVGDPPPDGWAKPIDAILPHTPASRFAGSESIDSEIRVGEIYAWRSFKATAYGILTGHAKPQFYMPGRELHAQCAQPTLWGYEGGPTFDRPGRHMGLRSPQRLEAGWTTERVPINMLPTFSDGYQTMNVWEMEDGSAYYNPDEPKVWYTNPDPPHDGWQSCTCGVYAYHTGDNGLRGTAFPVVQGVVALSGHVLVGTNGYRATRARVVGLLDPRRDTRVLHVRKPDGELIAGPRTDAAMSSLLTPYYFSAFRQMAEAYGPHATIFEDVEDMFTRYRFDDH